MQKNMVPVLILAGATVAASLYLWYRAAYVFRHGAKAIPPVEARVAARWHRSKLDTELAKILGTTETR